MQQMTEGGILISNQRGDLRIDERSVTECGACAFYLIAFFLRLGLITEANIDDSTYGNVLAAGRAQLSCIGTQLHVRTRNQKSQNEQ